MAINQKEDWGKCWFWKEGDGIGLDMLTLSKMETSKCKYSVRGMEDSRTEVRDLRIK